ncbi:MAG TPA: hypothetical protein VGO09_06265, partial [Flavisolibacter sp.]|nr:hypothetical protein [Flavisolibacter sp.]
MKEFMLLIRNKNDVLSNQDESHHNFLFACNKYISKLIAEKKLISAQPLIWEGKVISCRDGKWEEMPFNESNEIQVGYYHIFANDLEEAIKIAKENP